MLARSIVVLGLCTLFSLSAFAQKSGPKTTEKPVAREIGSSPAISTKPAAGPIATKPAASKCGTIGLSTAEVADIVDRHNKIRAELKLAPLTWDCRLADMAQTWANRGVFEHRSNIAEGENIFVSTNSADTTGSVVTAWLNERNNWNAGSSTCSAGKICTHYTQLVWRKTSAVGCGINRNAPGKWKALVVCNYLPAGNTGGAPY